MRLTDDDRARLLDAAREAGFCAAGIAPLEALVDPRFDGWLASGFHGSMRYLERFASVRAAPRRAFPKYASVLVAASEYAGAADVPRDPASAAIARYALGSDYHGVVRARLRAVQARLRESLPDLWTRPFVDSGPLNEKLAAALSGAGWVGKHTNLIHRGRGSWTVLGLLLLGAEAPPPTPAKDYCGRCTRCLAACPTGAIVAPYVLDARRCVSYLTIEHQGPIPADLRPLIGNRIFGCDDCQEVCPWNRFAARDADEPFRPRAGLQGRPLEEWIGLDAATFATLLRGSAMLRAGRDALVRNALIAAGNAAAAGAASETLRAAAAARLADAAPVVRGAAAWALGRFRDGAPTLRARRPLEDDPEVRAEIDAALGAHV